MLRDVQLSDGTWTWCRGFRDGLPVFGWNMAPRGLVTKTQLWAAGLRRRPRQDPVGLIVWKRGKRTAELYERDRALPKRQMSDRWRASLTQMYLAHCTCRRCGVEQDGYVTPLTWMCTRCMEITGDFGQPDDVDLAA